MKLEHDRGGEGPRLLVLLHGLGATRHVWNEFLNKKKWNGRWIAPDLRGHGASAHASSYALGLHAADVAETVQALGNFDEIVVLGHSMGGVIALALASGWFGIRPQRAFGLGIKVAWNDEERAGMAKMATMPIRTFAAREEAVARYLKISGLAGFAAPDSEAAQAGIAQTKDGWRPAFDPATASIGPPPMRALLAAAQAPVHLACGETDAMVTREQMAVFDSDARSLPGGHNVMVENPGAVWDWIGGFVA
ncbi:MAG TPA: alpha/beta hydrolase [Rhizomicrobium sp.]|nr:alpha/beta hydrolase [Rhizomicrobium sp.]